MKEIKQRDYISSQTTADSAPDRAEVGVLGNVECHYAVQGNLNSSHPEQQDRASVYALPEAEPSRFESIIDDVFSQMHDRYKKMLNEKSIKVGNACISMLLFDPMNGKLAIGSKGDGATYMIIRDRKNPEKVAIRRISTEYQNLFTMDEKGKMFNGPSMISKDFPTLWAHSDSWQKDGTALFAKEDAPQYETIDVRKLANDIIMQDILPPPEQPKQSKWSFGKLLGRKAQPAIPQIQLKDYDISIALSSDGIINGCTSEAIKSRLRNIAKATANSENRAQAILEYATAPHHPGDGKRTKDNLSSVVLSDLRFGAGDVVAACVADGNHNADMSRVHEGSVVAQDMIDSFESSMESLRSQATTQDPRPRDHGRTNDIDSQKRR